jgi:hypothetical protein
MNNEKESNLANAVCKCRRVTRAEVDVMLQSLGAVLRRAAEYEPAQSSDNGIVSRKTHCYCHHFPQISMEKLVLSQIVYLVMWCML